MSDNNSFLEIVLNSFKEFVKTGTSRSPAKLKPLHGAVASDIEKTMGEQYRVYAQGYLETQERKIEGRYIDKRVDITIEDTKLDKIVGGVSVKFVMQNYSQNSNNYFENMLGETANIRAAHCPYFQIFIILDEIPYYSQSGSLSRWETFTAHNILKYCRLSQDNIDAFCHTPNKTLIYVVHVDPKPLNALNREQYLDFYKRNIDSITIKDSAYKYEDFANGGTVILNDYSLFLEKVFYTIKAQ